MPSNPFPGLRPFDRTENDRFFGREEHLDELLRRLRSHRFVAVIGASGSGKSSLVRAGLLPSLEGGFMAGAGADWRIAILRPGTDPVGELADGLTAPEIFGSAEDDPFDRELERDMTAATLRRSRHGLVQRVREARMAPTENLLVVIDQFEELFRYRAQLQDRISDEASASVRLLLTAAEEPEVPVYVVITMRSDFLGDCAQFAGLPEAINESQYLVPRLSRSQLERAIKGPIGVGGARIAGPLLQQLLNDVSDDPDQLPILQHALMRTFDRWLEVGDGREPLGLEHYRAIGGMEEALSRHADEAYAELAPAHRPIAETLFKSLTEKGADGRGVRRPTRLAELAAVAGADETDVASVVEVFRAPGRTFLMPPPKERPELSSEQVIDISHESLMRVWRRLEAWVEEEAESARFYRRLAETAKLYPDEAGLWGNPELELAARWREESRPTADWAERYGGGFEQAISFLEASQEAWDEEQRVREVRRRADRSKRLAFQSDKVLPDDHELALLLAVAAGRASPTDEAERALRQVLDHPGRSFALLRGHHDRVVDVAWSAGAGETPARLASAGLDGTVLVWDPARHELLHELSAHKTAVRLAWCGDGRLLATAGIDGMARIWDTETGRELRSLAGHEAGIADAAWTGDDRLFATAGFDATARIWDAASGTELQVLQGHEGWLWRLAWRPGGDRPAELATASGDGTARIWDAASGAELQVLRGHGDKLHDVAWSPAGDRLATASSDGTARIWDAASGAELQVLRGHGDWVVAVAWASDGRRLATASRDGTARIWDAAEGREIHRLLGHGGGIQAISWSTGDRLVLTAGEDATARVWDGGTGAPAAVLTGHRGPVRAARWIGSRRDVQAVATGSEDGTVRLWDPGPGFLQLPRSRERLPARILDAVWSPDGERIATAHHDGAVRTWSSTDGAVLREARLPPVGSGGASHPPGPVSAVAWSPDGQSLLAVGRDHRAAVWNLAAATASPASAGEGARVFTGHRSAVLCGAFDPAGRRVATGGHDGRVCLWRPAAPADDCATADHGGAVTALAWNGDGSRLLTAGDDATLVVWETGGEESLELRRLHTLEGHSSAVLDAAWDPSFRRAASVGMDQTVRVWDTVEGALDQTLVGHRSWTLHLAWSPDGRQVASAGRDGTARLWALDEDADGPGSGGRVLAGHRGAVHRVAFDGAGERLLTAGQDGTVRLWHAALGDELRGHEIAILARHGKGVVRAGWSPAGGRVLTASLDRTVRVHRARIEDLVDEAARRAVRGPLPEEVAVHGLEAAAEKETAPREPAPVVRAASAAEGPEPGAVLRIGGIIFAENDWARELHRGMLAGRERAERELGVQVELAIEHHEFDLTREIALIDRFLAEGVDGIVLSPRDLEASVPKIREAHERGVVVVCVGTSINLRDAERYADSFYESDQFELGYRTGHYLAQWLVDRGLDRKTLELGIVQCERFEQCYQRGQGFRAALAHTGVPWREVANVEGLVMAEATRRAGELLREHPEVLVLFTEHDESTRGAVEAVRELGLEGRVFVFGTDIAASIAQMLAAEDDVLQATTGQQARRMGEDGVFDAVARRLGRDVGPFHKVLASPLYTREPWDAEKLRAWDEEGDSE